MTDSQAPGDVRVQHSSRDRARIPGAVAGWLATKLPPGAEPEVTLLPGADANGVSTETLMLDVSWRQDGGRRTGEYVARLVPSVEDVRVFESYELRDQYDAMRIVGESSGVPVPRVWFMEDTGEVLGTPFFLMERVDGVVPPDVMPYTCGDNWLFDASPEDQRRLQQNTVKTLADLHSIPDAADAFAFLDPKGPGDTALRRTLARTRSWYEFAARELAASPLVERGLDWLEANVPDTAETVLVWGDARLGNMMYADFAPVAVLDWEMASLGPRELDLSWLVFAHRVFESIAAVFELPGMPHFLREEDVVASYTELTGVEVGDLHWYHVHSAVNWGVIFLRVGTRAIHFGEFERPDDVETLMHHRALFESLLDDAERGTR